MWQWNEQTTAEFRQMWSDGLTGGKICQSFHERYGICPTRSAIMGKVYRSDLPKRKRFHGTIKIQREKKPRGPYKPRKYVSVFDRPEAQPIPNSHVLPGSSPGPLMSLRRNHCRWPVDGAGIDALFCRDTRFEKFPYCLVHCRMAYQPVAA